MSLDPQPCAFVLYGETYDPPQPQETCTEDALDGGDFCADHVDLDAGPDPDDERDRLIDCELGL